MQISKEQCFPEELKYEQHTIKPFQASSFKGKIFELKDKPKVRIYKLPPVRNFLAQNINEKWLYWGLVYLFEVIHDNVRQTISGKFEIIFIYAYNNEHDYSH